MRFGRFSFERHAGAAVRRVLFALAVAGLFMGCGGCSKCSVNNQRERVVLRATSDISDFSVVFIDGEATLFWVDSTDLFFDHVEISWEPRTRLPAHEETPSEDASPEDALLEDAPVTVEKGIETYVIPNLEEGIEYTFTLTAVDKWGNKSDTTEGGTGKAFKQHKPEDASPLDVMSIKGTPTAAQAILSWTNLDDSEYDHIEITYAPGYETLFRVPKGVESKMLMNLVNDVEHTFYVRAVDSKGNRKPLDEVGLFISDLPTSPESVFGRSSDGEIILVWKNPSNPQFDFVETVYSPGGEIPSAVDQDQQTSTFNDLSDITDYEFTVYAVDISGHRRPITKVDLLTPRIPTFDGKDADKIVARGWPVAGQIRLNWNDPPMQNLEHIAVIHQPGNNDTPVTVAKGYEAVTFNGLSDDQEYRFLVYGVDSKMNNRIITGVRLFTPQISELVAQPVSGRATLVWDNPEYSHFGHIEVSYEPGLDKPIRVARGTERYTFTGLSDRQEYTFKVTAVTTAGDTHAVASARVNVTRLPVLVGAPIDRQLSLAWIDPTDVAITRIEILCSPGSEQPRSIARGLESATFPNLSDDIEYSFTVYAVDSAGNRYPVQSPKFYDPNTAFIIHSESARRRPNLAPLNWRASNNNVFGSSTVYALAFGIAANGSARWVAGGADGQMAYSNDYGLSWVQVSDSTFGSYSIDSLHYANGRWIAVGKNGKMAWSTNALTWNSVRRFNFTVNFNINVVTFGNGRWMAGGSNGSIIASDDNGVSWRRTATNALGQSAINTLVYNDGRWMAGGTAGKIAYSDDNGVTWIPVAESIFGNSAINVIIYDEERWLAGGYAQRMAWSEDGTTWRPLARPFYILCMNFNGFRWIAGGQRGRMVWSADSGDSWIVDDQSYNFFGENWIQAIAFGKSPDGKIRWLAAGQNGKIIYADEP